MSEFRDDIRQAVNILRKGGVILYPTDTVWGIGCDARNSEAVARIFKIKQRADAKAMICLVGTLAQLERAVDEVPEVAYDLIEHSERPLTIVYDKPNLAARLAPEILAEDGSFGVRVTAETFSAELCRVFGAPLVSTSANISGKPTPRNFAEISPEILSAVDYVCISRRNDKGIAKSSSVLRLTCGGEFKFIRK